MLCLWLKYSGTYRSASSRCEDHQGEEAEDGGYHDKALDGLHLSHVATGTVR